LFVVGALILLGLLGHVLNQQRLSKHTLASEEIERQRRESSTPSPVAPSSDQTGRDDAGDRRPPAAPVRVMYTVAHKHRLRDCHGRLTFTRQRLRFDSDEPQDSFDVGLADVKIEGEVLHIRNKPWRFEFNDGVSAERLFKDWKAGTLPRPVPAP
jgi:hypothetical protein